MATSLSAQLAQIAASSKSALNLKAQKAAHSKSLIWEARVATTQSYQTLYAICHQGFEELCQLDSRFTPFGATIFSEESQSQDRTQLTAADNQELDRHIEAFLRLVGSRLRLLPAIKAVEWLIRRFQIHTDNTAVLLMAFLPYHSITAFATLLSILPANIPTQFRFLDPYIRSLTCPPRSVFVHHAVHHPAFLSAVSEYTLESCRKQFQYPALIAFWGGLITEGVSGILDRTKSGRATVRSENSQAMLHRLGPVFAESLVMKKVPSLQIASYMAMTVFVSKGDLEDVAVTALMQQLVHGWTSETVRPGLVCLAILAQYRSAKQMSSKVTKALMKVPDIGTLLVEIGQGRRVDKIANGLCLALVERLTKKGDSRGLSTVISILSNQILKEKQIAVIFKSLLVTAHALNDENDEDGALRRELGSTLISLSQISGKSGDVIQAVIEEVKFDIEELEMKLDLSFRTRRLPESALETETGKESGAGVPQTKAPVDFDKAIGEMSSANKETLSDCLLSEPTEIFNDFSHLFLSIVSKSQSSAKADHDFLAQFDQIPKLQRQTALKDCTYFSFFIRIWCGAFPALVRVAALDMVKNRLKAGGAESKMMDVQALVPYCVAALSDASKRVRQAAADLITVVTGLYPIRVPPVSAASKSATVATVWGVDSLYGKAAAAQSKKVITTLGTDVVTRMLHLQILPAVEECVIDMEHISVIIKSAIETGRYHAAAEPLALEKKDHMSSSARLALLSFFSSHASATPLTLVKNRLLKSLNEVRGVSSTTRTQLLLPALQWWVSLTEAEAAEICRKERLERSVLDSRFVDVIVPNDIPGLEYLFQLLRDPANSDKASLIQAVFERIKRMWPSMKDEVKFLTAEQFLQLSQEHDPANDRQSIIHTEAAHLLRSVPLTTNILSFFLDSIQTGTKMITEPPPNKRRRTSSSDGARGGHTVQVTPELSMALRKVTFVLQLVDSSEPVSHPELLDGLFTALSELQHFRTVVGSELGYLQNLILRSLLAMMPAYKANKDLKIDNSGGYGDLLVNCIQKSSSPVVQNAALLLVASLATTAPNLVLHSVMPIFTFMGTSVLRQSDDYSAHVVAQTIKEVVPPMIASLRQGQKSPIAGASDVLVSFTTAYEHIPAHRRQGLFVALVQTLGAKDFLFALISMLVDRYELSDELLSFATDLLNHFDTEIQLESFIKLLDLVSDLFKPKPGLSFVLLGVSDDGGGGGKDGKDNNKDVEKMALRQLSALPSLLSNKKLKTQIGKLADREDDMQTAEVRQLYATLLEDVLVLAESVKVKASKSLHGRCGSALSNLLNLLSIGEFIRAVENLLDRPNLDMRHKVLRALEVRVESESTSSAASRTALLAFLPQLTAGIRESGDVRYKHTAVTCVDKIAEKYGKKDIEAVVAAAATLASEHCLGQGDKRLRVMALLCLSSLVDVLQDAIIPVLPVAIPQAIAFLNESLESEGAGEGDAAADEELHSASFGFLSALAEHLPYMLSTYVDGILEVATKSAEAGLDSEANESRLGCLQILARKLEAKEMFAGLLRVWDKAASAGFSATSEYLDILGMAIDKHTKSAITKNAGLLSSIILQTFDLRRRLHVVNNNESETSLGQVDVMEASMYEKTLKMIYKLNDAAFRPIFLQIMEWPGDGLSKSDTAGRSLRHYTVFGFLHAFFTNLKSIVTSYATYILDDAVRILQGADVRIAADRHLWSRVLQTLARSFEHDQDDFWQAPAHFGAIAPVLVEQFLHAGAVGAATAAERAAGRDVVVRELVPATVELAAAADSQVHQKEVNAALLRHLRSEVVGVRLAAVKCQQALTDRLGEEWLAMLHEMLPRISELQEDDDEEVERETHRWIVKIEGVLGESLDSMLQ